MASPYMAGSLEKLQGKKILWANNKVVPELEKMIMFWLWIFYNYYILFNPSLCSFFLSSPSKLWLHRLSVAIWDGCGPSQLTRATLGFVLDLLIEQSRLDIDILVFLEAAHAFSEKEKMEGEMANFHLWMINATLSDMEFQVLNIHYKSPVLKLQWL